MAMVPEMKICPICGKKYSWNPDVGKIFCPYCKDRERSENGMMGEMGKIELKPLGNGKLKF